jgi:hypothetical protein
MITLSTPAQHTPSSLGVTTQCDLEHIITPPTLMGGYDDHDTHTYLILITRTHWVHLLPPLLLLTTYLRLAFIILYRSTTTTTTSYHYRPGGSLSYRYHYYIIPLPPWRLTQLPIPRLHTGLWAFWSSLPHLCFGGLLYLRAMRCFFSCFSCCCGLLLCLSV